MSRRFYCSDPPEQGRATLRGSEAHHLMHVVRLGVGDEVVLFDGSNVEHDAIVAKLTRDAVELEITASREVDRERSAALVLGVALPKGDRQKWLVEKCVELGVTRLVPLSTERGVAQPTDKVLERLRRGVIEASKQCGRNRLMEVADAVHLASFLQTASGDTLRLFAMPGGASLGEMFGQQQSIKHSQPVQVAVGPEGGFTDEELTQAREAGWLAVDLGPRILRVETAALFMAALTGIADEIGNHG